MKITSANAGLLAQALRDTNEDFGVDNAKIDALRLLTVAEPNNLEANMEVCGITRAHMEAAATRLSEAADELAAFADQQLLPLDQQGEAVPEQYREAVDALRAFFEESPRFQATLEERGLDLADIRVIEDPEGDHFSLDFRKDGGVGPGWNQIPAKEAFSDAVVMTAADAPGGVRSRLLDLNAAATEAVDHSPFESLVIDPNAVGGYRFRSKASTSTGSSEGIDHLLTGGELQMILRSEQGNVIEAISEAMERNAANRDFTGGVGSTKAELAELTWNEIARAAYFLISTGDPLADNIHPTVVEAIAEKAARSQIPLGDFLGDRQLLEGLG